jgi:hypothetical protein
MKKLQNNNFWEENLELSMIKEFDEIYSADKYKNKEESSKLMQAIYFAYNPESPLFNLPNRLEIIARDHLKDSKFNWESLSKQIAIYKDLVLTDAERALINWNETMKMRDNAMKILYQEALQSKDVDTLKKIDTMLANTPKMFDDYKKVRKDFEEQKTLKKGSKIKSLSDSNEM